MQFALLQLRPTWRALFVVLAMCTMPSTPRMLDAQAMPGMPMPHADSTPMKMMTADPLGVSMDRMGSGTTWIPDAVPLPSRFFTVGRWDLTLHGFAFVQANRQDDARGASQLGSLNWGMFMASHELAGGRFQARTMLSLDPFTVTPRGYPLLLQTGESFHGEQLHDRQHPHDFWMESVRCTSYRSRSSSARCCTPLHQASPHLGRLRSCTGRRQWTFPRRQSVITGKTPRTFRSAS